MTALSFFVAATIVIGLLGVLHLARWTGAMQRGEHQPVAILVTMVAALAWLCLSSFVGWAVWGMR